MISISKNQALAKARAWPEARCHYCNRRKAVTYDHIVPRVLGGPNAQWNLVPSCRHCNQKKAARMPTCDCQKCRQAVDLWNAYRP